MPFAPMLATEDATLSELLSNGVRYEVPAFQREYAWDEDNWEDLWLDLAELEKEPQSSHYMGSIVLKQLAPNRFQIIDGQQRITTLSLLALAVVRHLERLAEANLDADQNRERASLMLQSYLARKDPVALVSQTRLKLSDQDDGFFRDLLIEGRPVSTLARKLKSPLRLEGALRYFQNRLSERFGTEPGENVARFFEEVVAPGLLFVRVSVQDDASAYSVFETLNARGVSLTTSDLLKNYLLSLAGNCPDDANAILRGWNEVTQYVPPERLPEFLKHYLSGEAGRVRQDRVFKELRRAAPDPERGLALLDQVRSLAPWYEALSDPDHEAWSGMEDARRSVEALRRFGARQYLSLALAWVARFETDGLEKLLRLLVIVTFRYSVVSRRNPGDAETAYTSAARALRSAGNAADASHRVRAELAAIFVEDEDFGNDLRTLAFATSAAERKIGAYVLSALEDGSPLPSTLGAGPSVEHILPESWEAAHAAFPDWTEEQHARYRRRLGNLALLEPSVNRKLNAAPLDQKLEAYHASRYRTTREIDVAEWTPGVLDERQRGMARSAKAVWHLS